MQRTFLVPLTLALAGLGAACGPSAKEVERARAAHYSCDYEAVFKAVFKEVEAQQPPIRMADPDRAVVVSDFRWHDEHGQRKKRGAAVVGEGDVAFSVAVAIERREAGWFVRAVPHVLAQEPDSPHGMELTPDHGDWPQWADGKVDALLVGVRERLGSCEVVAGVP